MSGLEQEVFDVIWDWSAGCWRSTVAGSPVAGTLSSVVQALTITGWEIISVVPLITKNYPEPYDVPRAPVQGFRDAFNATNLLVFTKRHTSA